MVRFTGYIGVSVFRKGCPIENLADWITPESFDPLDNDEFVPVRMRELPRQLKQVVPLAHALSGTLSLTRNSGERQRRKRKSCIRSCLSWQILWHCPLTTQVAFLTKILPDSGLRKVSSNALRMRSWIISSGVDNAQFGRKSIPFGMACGLPIYVLAGTLIQKPVILYAV